MFIKPYNEFIVESKDISFEIPAESDILKWTKEAEGGDITAFSKLLDIIKKAFPKNFKDVRKINLAHRGVSSNKVLFE